MESSPIPEYRSSSDDDEPWIKLRCCTPTHATNLHTKATPSAPSNQTQKPHPHADVDIHGGGEGS